MDAEVGALADAEDGELGRYLHLVWDAFRSAGITHPMEVIEQITYILRMKGLVDRTSIPDTHGESTGRDPDLLARIGDILDQITTKDRHTSGQIYASILRKLMRGDGGQFTTPPHIVRLMIEMMAPNPDDVICDPACGTGEFLIAASEYLHVRHSYVLTDARLRQHFHENMFHGFDWNQSMVQISCMNLLLHGVEQPDVRQRDLLSGDGLRERGRYSLILTNPPFAGTRDLEKTSGDLLEVVRSKKSELLFLAAVLHLLKQGGRAAVIVPESVLFGSTAAHIEIRRILVEQQKLDGIVRLPPITFRPYTGISTAILIFTKTDRGGTDYVWFYDVTSDGWSPDDRRRPLLNEDRLGPVPSTALTDEEHSANNLPDVLTRWSAKATSERRRDPGDQSFVVPLHEIVTHGYDLSLQRYRAAHEQRRLAQEKVRRLGELAMVFSGWVPASDLDSNADRLAPLTKRVLHPSLLGPSLPNVEDLPVRQSEKEPNRRLKPGDIIGRDLATARHWTVLPSEYEGVQAGSGLIVVRPTDDAYPAEYLAEYLASPQAERQFPKYGVIPRIRAAELIEILIPSCDGDTSWINSAVLRMREGPAEVRRIQSVLDGYRAKVFESCSSTERRARLAEAADLSVLTAQNLSKQQEPYRVFQQTYPYGIARAVRRLLHSSTSVRDKHEASLQCAESLILTLGIMSLAVAADRGWRDLPEVVAWSESVEHGGVSLGHWVGVIRAAGGFARSGREEAAGLAEATSARKGGKGLISDLESLVAIRNKIRHGGGPRTQAEVEKSLKGLEPLVFRSLAASSFLARSDWVYPAKLRWLPEASKFRIYGLAVMGDHPDFEPKEFHATQPLADERLYIVGENFEPIPLAPFCVLADCPSCLAPELYYPDRLGQSTAKLKSLDRGHELESSTVFAALRSWMNP